MDYRFQRTLSNMPSQRKYKNKLLSSAHLLFVFPVPGFWEHRASPVDLKSLGGAAGCRAAGCRAAARSELRFCIVSYKSMVSYKSRASNSRRWLGGELENLAAGAQAPVLSATRGNLGTACACQTRMSSGRGVSYTRPFALVVSLASHLSTSLQSPQQWSMVLVRQHLPCPCSPLPFEPGPAKSQTPEQGPGASSNKPEQADLTHNWPQGSEQVSTLAKQ